MHWFGACIMEGPACQEEIIQIVWIQLQNVGLVLYQLIIFILHNAGELWEMANP